CRDVHGHGFGEVEVESLADVRAYAYHRQLEQADRAFEVGLDVFLLPRNRFDSKQLLAQGGHLLLLTSLSVRRTGSRQRTCRCDEPVVVTAWSLRLYVRSAWSATANGESIRNSIQPNG